MMIEITADASDYPFTVFPETLEQEVAQNVMLLLLVIRGTQPLERGLGISPHIIDRPMQLVQTELSAEVYDQIEKYEPRAVIEQISFRYDPLNARVIPTVGITIKS